MFQKVEDIQKSALDSKICLDVLKVVCCNFVVGSNDLKNLELKKKRCTNYMNHFQTEGDLMPPFNPFPNGKFQALPN